MWLKIFSSISICVFSFVNCLFRPLLFSHFPVQVFPLIFFNLNFLLLFNYSCVPFLPIPPPYPVFPIDF